MTMNYYLAWLHFDAHGRMTTRLPDGHRVLEVLHNSGSNRHPPALWVLIEAVVATPSYTPANGFPSAAEMPVETYRQPTPHQQPPAGHPSMPIPLTSPLPSRTEQYSHRETGNTTYPELYPETRDARDNEYREDEYRNSGDFIPGPNVPMSPTSRM